MKVTSIETIPVRIPLRPERQMISALGKHEASSYLIVRINTDREHFGVGEATVTPSWSGETVWTVQAIIRDVLAPAIVGMPCEDIDAILSRMESVAVCNWFAKSAIEMAIWDLLGKERKQPVFELLGGVCRATTIRSRFSLGAYPPTVAAERAYERIQAGFDTIKVKVGTHSATDVERVKAVRKMVGNDVALTIDANGGWNYEEAVWALTQLKDMDIDIVEQPLPRKNFSQLKKLRNELGIRILADESCFDEIDAVELIEQGCCDAITVYPGKNGGILKAKRIAEYAAKFEIPCTIGSNLEWDIATAAMMHLVVSTPNLAIERYPGDCLGPAYHEFSIVKEPLEINGPFTTISLRPGLGIEVDWAKVAENRIRNSE
jgi:L-Ala-D/L-Glu epimerase